MGSVTVDARNQQDAKRHQEREGKPLNWSKPRQCCNEPEDRFLGLRAIVLIFMLITGPVGVIHGSAERPRAAARDELERSSRKSRACGRGGSRKPSPTGTPYVVERPLEGF